MIKPYFNLKNYNKYIVTKHSNPRNHVHPPSRNLNKIANGPIMTFCQEIKITYVLIVLI